VYTTLYLGQLSGTLRIPLGYIYAILPVSGLLIMWFSVYHMSKIIVLRYWLFRFLFWLEKS